MASSVVALVLVAMLAVCVSANVMYAEQYELADMDVDVLESLSHMSKMRKRRVLCPSRRRCCIKLVPCTEKICTKICVRVAKRCAKVSQRAPKICSKVKSVRECKEKCAERKKCPKPICKSKGRGGRGGRKGRGIGRRPSGPSSS